MGRAERPAVIEEGCSMSDAMLLTVLIAALVVVTIFTPLIGD